ncbi:MAG TPA: hypothetical protein VKB38_21575 [Terracidiphilus sp.]|nr:hypothetical protein [Terracidiphilus sp.]
MSDVGVSYSIQYSPNPVGVNLNVSIANTSVRVTLSGVPPLAVTATPNFSGNIIVSALSAITTPLANVITLSLGAFAGNLMNGRTFDVASLPAIPFDIEGVRGTITPSNLSISNFNGQLKVSGDVSVR